MSATCEYIQGYINPETKQHDEYSCPRECVATSSFCKFHDDSYFEENQPEIRRDFLEELDRHDGADSIYFIGCNIPSFNIAGTRQHRKIYFNDATFHGRVRLSSIRCSIIDFTDAMFHNDLKIFNSNADMIIFYNMRFAQNAENQNNIDGNNPEEIVNTNIEFESCGFKKIEFSMTTMPKNLLFKNCNMDHSKFIECEFNGTFSMIGCVFTEKIDFTGSKFLMHAIFSQTAFNDTVTFQHVHFKNITEFHGVNFQKQKTTIFQGDLSNVSFLNTDISRIRFDVDTKWDKDNKYVIFDERNISHCKSSLNSVLAVYRNLRENYEFQLMYEEAGKFFVREMDLQRIYYQDKTGKITRKKIHQYISLSYCYKKLSNYGEDLNKILVCGVLLFLGTFVYFFCFPDIDGSKTDLSDTYRSKISTDHWYRAQITLERTFGAFFQINKDGIADYIVRIASLPILGMMFIALRRKYERRFRH